MKQLTLALAMILITTHSVQAQRYYTKNGSISFLSKTAMEDIKADNNQVMSVLNTQTGELRFSLLIKSFHFQKALMEEHFNENYMESSKFPKASFAGTITDASRIDFNKDGIYKVNVDGDLTMHGVTKKVSSIGTVTINAGKISADSEFPIKIADYNISVPKLVKDNIAETINIKVHCNFDQKM
ncbi:MAG: YceI family protein [Ferruginibacter sp.]